MEENKLIVVEQLPIIKEYLEELKGEIQLKVKTANELVCTEDTVKEVKQVRTDLNKQFKELEEQRKAVKNAVMNPYNEFETIYKENVSELFKEADNTLKMKIDNVENNLKEIKENEIKEYFEELKLKSNIDFINYEDLNINVTLTVSKKSLKEEVSSKLEQISNDLLAIRNMQYAEEIEVEYRKHRKLGLAIKDVQDRHFVLEQVKNERVIEQERLSEENKVVEKVEDVLSAPIVEEDKEYCLIFKVIGTKSQLQELKSFLMRGGYKYE